MTNKGTITRHSLRIKYDRKARTYSGELVVKETAAPKETTFRVERKHKQHEFWKDGMPKLIQHHYWENITQEVGFPKRGTRAWKQARRN